MVRILWSTVMKNSTNTENSPTNIPTDSQKNEDRQTTNNKKTYLDLSSYTEWFKSRLKLLSLVLLVVTSLVFAVLVCVVVWTFINHNLLLSEQPLIAHKPNQVDLYKNEDENFRVPIPKDDNISQSDTDDVDTYTEIGGQSEMDPDKPTFAASDPNEVNLETEQDMVSHNEIIHDDAAEEIPMKSKEIENAEEQQIPLRQHKGFLEALRKEHNAISDRIKSDKLKEQLLTPPIKLSTEPIQLIKPSPKPIFTLTKSKKVNDNHSIMKEKVHMINKAIEISSIINKKEQKDLPPPKKKEVNEFPPANPHPTKTKEMEKTPTLFKKTATKELTSPPIENNDAPAMELYRVSNAVKAGAVCLDGSPPAYYHRPGTGNSEKLWIIHFNGGAWCFDVAACFERSHSSLGSTKKLPPAPPIIQGINSPDPSINPDFYDWNLVWVVYCDGASFTGNREKPYVSEKGEVIYMRGKRVLNAIINDLLFNREFKFAEAIILTGSSAGSMTAIFQADYIASKFSRTVPVRVLSDAGFFIETSSIGGKNLGAMFKQIYAMQNSSAGLDQNCVRDMGLEKAWQCFFPSKTAKYVKTPMFVLNAAYDIWALIYFLNIDCKFPVVNKDKRKKRSILETMHFRNDSELELDMGDDMFDNSLHLIRKKRDTSDLINKELTIVKKRMKRDVSGFEIRPFFREPIKSRETIPSFNRVTPYYKKNITKPTAAHLPPMHEKNHSNNSIDIQAKINNIFDTFFHDKNHNKTFLSRHFSSNVSNKTFSTKPIDRKNIPNQKHQVMNKNKINNNSVNSMVKRPIKHIHSSNVNVSKVANHTVNTLNSNLHVSHGYFKPPELYMNDLTSQLQTKKLKFMDKVQNKLKDTTKKIKTDTKKGIKRQILNQTTFKRSSKWRRSTSIAKEYINILRSDPPECTDKELMNAMKYRNAIIHATNSLLHLPKSGRFIVSCIDHSLSLFDETWTSLVVGGKSIQQAFGDWFYERGNKSSYDSVDCPYPCNPTCP